MHLLVDYTAARLGDEALDDPIWAALDCVVNPSDA
jgi:hypothetical protein